MLVTFNENGGAKSKGGNSAQDYLLGNDEPRENARLLKGDPDATTEVINGLNFSKIYTSGTLAFAYNEGDKLSEKDKFDIIEKFENALFPNIPIEQVSGYWVEHTDKILRDKKTGEPILDTNGKEQKRLELNFIYANVELTTGKALPIYYHWNDVHLTSGFRDVINAEYELIDPNRIDYRQLLSIPKNLSEQRREILESAHDLVCAELSLGHINDRNDILKVLTDANIEIASEPTHKYISLRDPEGGQNIRMKGEIYEPEFTVENFIREHKPSEAKELEYSDAEITEARERLQYSTGKRAKRFERRFLRDEQKGYQVLREKDPSDVRENDRVDELDEDIELELDDWFTEDDRSISGADSLVTRVYPTPSELRERRSRNARSQEQENIGQSVRGAYREPQDIFAWDEEAEQTPEPSDYIINTTSGQQHTHDIDSDRAHRKNENARWYLVSHNLINFDSFRHFSLATASEGKRVNENSRADNQTALTGNTEATSRVTERTSTRDVERLREAQIDFIDITDSIEQFIQATHRTVRKVQHDTGSDRSHGQDSDQAKRDREEPEKRRNNKSNYIGDIIGLEDRINDLHSINEKIKIEIELREKQQRQEQQQRQDREWREQAALERKKHIEAKLVVAEQEPKVKRDDSYDLEM